MVRGLVLIVMLIEGTAWAGPALARARAALDISDYLVARAELATARDAGECSSTETEELYRLLGRVEAALGDSQAATEAFKRLLALSPNDTLPEGISPKIKRPFDSARDYYNTHSPLALEITTAATPPTITLIVVTDPLHMVAKARVVYSLDHGAAHTTDLTASQRTEFALPAGARIDARVTALDEYGNQLVELGSHEPIVILGEASRPVAAPAVVVHLDRRPIYLRWWPYAAATVAFAGATAYFGWAAYTTAIDLRTAGSDRDAQVITDRGRRDTLFTNIGFGVTGACAIAAGVMYLTRPHDRSETRIAAVPLPGGGAVMVGGTL
jgi:hypothetical protein